MKNKTIYVRLLDEGVEVYRPIKCEKIENDKFRIPLELTIPEDENWEFSPGDLIRCELMPLSERHEKKESLVAVERLN